MQFRAAGRRVVGSELCEPHVIKPASAMKNASQAANPVLFPAQHLNRRRNVVLVQLTDAVPRDAGIQAGVGQGDELAHVGKLATRSSTRPWTATPRWASRHQRAPPEHGQRRLVRQSTASARLPHACLALTMQCDFSCVAFNAASSAFWVTSNTCGTPSGWLRWAALYACAQDVATKRCVPTISCRPNFKWHRRSAVRMICPRRDVSSE